MYLTQPSPELKSIFWLNVHICIFYYFQLISSCSYIRAPKNVHPPFVKVASHPERGVWLTNWKPFHSTFVDWLAGGVSWDIKGHQVHKYTSELFHLSRCSGSTFGCTLKKMSNPGHLVLTLNRAEPGPSGLDIGHHLNPGEEGKASKTICSWLCVRHTHFGENVRQTLYIWENTLDTHCGWLVQLMSDEDIINPEWAAVELTQSSFNFEFLDL